MSEPLPSSSFVAPGNYTMQLDAAAMGLAGGMYFFEMRAGDFRKTVKMICGRPKVQ